jgi:hypothetical protein
LLARTIAGAALLAWLLTGRLRLLARLLAWRLVRLALTRLILVRHQVAPRCCTAKTTIAGLPVAGTCLFPLHDAAKKVGIVMV